MTGEFSILLQIPQGSSWRVANFERHIHESISPIDPDVSVRTTGGERTGYEMCISGDLTHPSDIIRIRKMITQGMRLTAPLWSGSYHLQLIEKGE